MSNKVYVHPAMQRLPSQVLQDLREPGQVCAKGWRPRILERFTDQPLQAGHELWYCRCSLVRHESFKGTMSSLRGLCQIGRNLLENHAG